jgi:all-trans-retinol dehydrogenase (NAD+)
MLSIVTMASLASFVAATGSLEYSISKVGALYLSDGIRAECLARYPGGEAICTTSVHPVWHKTNIVGEAEWKKLAQEGVRVDPPSNVSRVVVKQVLMGKSARLFVPEKMRWIAGIRSWPIWVQDLIMGDWRGKRRAGFKRNPEP